MVSNETLIQDLQQVRERLGRQIKQKDLREHGDWCVRTFQTEFGSWNNALEAAGLELNQRSTLDTTDEDFIEDLHRVTKIVKRTPRRDDVDEHGKWAADTYRRNMLGDGLSKWNEVLSEAGFEVYYEKGSSEPIKYTCEQCGDTFELMDYRNPRRFCGAECYGKYRQGKYTGKDSWSYNSKEVECEWCGDTLAVRANP